MAILNFKGKPFVQNYHLSVKYHELVPQKSKSLTDKVRLTDNLVVHGDNLKALKALLPTYAGKVKCIYIDPPYNTGNEKWVYNDNVNSPMMQEWLGKIVDREDLTRHDKWLCMMMPRLKLLRELLSDDGIILISIDDNELKNLLSLCDDVFNESNRFGVIVIQNNPRGRRLGTELAVEHEYLVAYSKEIMKFKAGRLELTDEQLAEYSEIDKNGKRYRLLGLRKRGALARRQDRPNLHFPLFIDPKTKTVHLDDQKGRVKIIPKLSDGSEGVWRWSKGKIEKESDLLIATLVKRRETQKEEWDVFQKDYAEGKDGDSRGRLFPSIWEGSEFNNETGRDQIKDLFGKAVFDYPKPVDLIKHAILLSGDKNALVLDSFAGSGTTGQAVIELNRSDGGNRKFILAECEDYAESITAERVKRVIKGEPSAKRNGQSLALESGETFSFFELGRPIELERILDGKHLPDYEDLARYLFYTATGEEFDEKQIDEKKGFIGESEGYKVYLFYEPRIDSLKQMALTLDRAKALGKYNGKRRLVFAPTKFMDQDMLDEMRIDFAQLPFEIYKFAD
ncbi:MAG: site-specific DNA-methyltransferase [Candidatus Omnitrophota bacterium]